MCEYCDEMKSIYWNDDYKVSTVREVYIEQDGTLSISSNASYEDENYDINIKINYCPSCGRKLSEDNE